jgi:sugar phosphate permease
MWVAVFGILCLIIGIICAAIVSGDDSDQVKGNKRICAVFFIMLSLIVFFSLWTKKYCQEGIDRTIKEYTGYVPGAPRALGGGKGASV